MLFWKTVGPNVPCLVFLISLAATCCHGWSYPQEKTPAREAESKPAPVEIDLFVPLKENALLLQPTLFGRGGLGDLQPDTDYIIHCSLFNSSESPYQFESVSTGCLCSEARFPKGVLGSGQAVEGEIRLKTPRSTSNGEFSMQMRFFKNRNPESGNESAYLELAGRLAGNLHIDKSRSVLVPEHGLNEWRIPMSFTAPISAETLTLSASESLHGVVTRIESANDRHWLVILADHGALEDDTLAGTIGIKDSATGRSDELNVVIAKTPPATISPQVLRFRRTDETSGIWKANAMLQISTSPPSDNGASTAAHGNDQTTQGRSRSRAKDELGVIIQCELNGVEVEIEKQELQPGRIYKLVLHLDEASPPLAAIMNQIEAGEFKSDSTPMTFRIQSGAESISFQRKLELIR